MAFKKQFHLLFFGIVDGHSSDYNAITQHVAKEPYSAGLHFIGVGHRFLRFPNIQLNMQFSTAEHDLLHTRTADGLPLTLGFCLNWLLFIWAQYCSLGLSFQYTLIQADLFDLYDFYLPEFCSFSPQLLCPCRYMNFKMDYERVLFNVASNILANVATNFTAYNFFNDKVSTWNSFCPFLRPNHLVSYNF